MSLPKALEGEDGFTLRQLTALMVQLHVSGPWDAAAVKWHKKWLIPIAQVGNVIEVAFPAAPAMDASLRGREADFPTVHVSRMGIDHGQWGFVLSASGLGKTAGLMAELRRATPTRPRFPYCCQTRYLRHKGARIVYSVSGNLVETDFKTAGKDRSARHE